MGAGLLGLGEEATPPMMNFEGPSSRLDCDPPTPRWLRVWGALTHLALLLAALALLSGEARADAPEHPAPRVMLTYDLSTLEPETLSVIRAEQFVCLVAVGKEGRMAPQVVTLACRYAPLPDDPPRRRR